MTIIVNNIDEYNKISDFLINNNIYYTYEIYRENYIYIFTTFEEYYKEITKEVKQWDYYLKIVFMINLTMIYN